MHTCYRYWGDVSVVEEVWIVMWKTLGIDSTTLEPSAAMKSIVLRDNGMSHDVLLELLVKESRIETPSYEDLAKVGRKHKNERSNKHWRHPETPNAHIAKMKDGRTHLVHKYEHAVALETMPWLR